MAILPYSRAGITGAAMLGLGPARSARRSRVTLVVGQRARRSAKHLFDQGYTLAAVIANEFGEAASKPAPPRRADRGGGWCCFVLTLLVNALARYFVNRGARGAGVTPATWASVAAMSVLPVVSTRRKTHRSDRPDRAGRRGDRRARAARTGALVRDQEGNRRLELALPLHRSHRQLPRRSGAGSRGAILGTIEMVLIASLIAIPAGVGVALYLTEYGKNNRFAADGALLRGT